MISVVVPVYDVERYLPACLDSVLGQPVSSLEVIAVDDGSPDASADLVAERATQDPRIRLVRQSNAGLGAARNAGARLATGRYLAFCDSDDVLPDDAWSALVASLERTGSDVGVGALVRDDGRRQVMGPLMKRNHAQPRERVRVATMPLLLADVFAVNKLFRRDFWVAHDLGFPEGVRYEDQPAWTRAYLAAASVDVLTEVVYRWRTRDDGTSITQGRHLYDDLRDRIETKRTSTRMVVEVGLLGVEEVWFTEILPIDMWEYFRGSIDAGDDYWALLVSAVREFWPPDRGGFAVTAVPVQQRLMGELVAADRREDLRRLVAALDDHGVRWRTTAHGDVLDLPGSEDPEIPARAWTREVRRPPVSSAPEDSSRF